MMRARRRRAVDLGRGGIHILSQAYRWSLARGGARDADVVERDRSSAGRTSRYRRVREDDTHQGEHGAKASRDHPLDQV